MKDKDVESVALPQDIGIALRRLIVGCAEYPDRSFFVSDNETLSYKEAHDASLSMISYLRNKLGLRSGMVVYASVSNTANFIVLLTAAEALGLRLALRSPGFIHNQLRADLDLLHPSLTVVSNDKDFEHVRSIAPDLHVMGVGDGVHCGKRLDLEASVAPHMDPNDLTGMHQEAQLILFSSGSSGKPKAIVNSASSFAFNASRLQATFGLSSSDTLYLPVPFFHVYGIVGIFTVFVSGATIATLLKYNPVRSTEFISHVGATVYFGVPTMYMRELINSNVDGVGECKLRAGMIAGANCPATAIKDYEERFGCTLIQSYGMTETAATLTAGSLDDSLEERVADAGYPIDGVLMTVDDSSGEVLVKTPALMKGLWSVKGFQVSNTDSDGWLHTGDIGRMTQRGTISIVGRLDDVIIRGGINIIPQAIEQVYRTHEDVAECYVVGYSDYELGQRTCLCVLPKQGLSQLCNLRDYAAGRLDKCEYPDRVVEVDSFPRLQNGKIDRRSLEKQINQKV